MKQAAAKQTTTKGENNKQPDFDGWLIGMQLLDTSWRVALPILLLSYVGISLDRHFHTNPLYSLIGFFTSLVVASILVYKQVKATYPDFFSSPKPKSNKDKR